MRFRRRKGRASKPKGSAIEVKTLFDLPMLVQRREEARGAAWDYFQQVGHLEAWAREGGTPPPPEFASLPLEHQLVLTRWPDAYGFYRHSLFDFLERVIGMNPWNMAFRSILRRLRDRFPDAFDEFINLAFAHSDRFLIQRKNAEDRFYASHEAHSLKEHVRQLLSTYADFYEIEFVLWFLGVLGKAHGGVFRPTAFGGPTTNQGQDTLIDQVSSAIRGTPLEVLLAASYDGDLRHACNHNSYEIEEKEGNDAVIRDLESGRAWNYDSLAQLVLNSFQLLMAVPFSIALLAEVETPDAQQTFHDYGIIAMHGGMGGDGVCQFIILQLWCFRDLDPIGLWIDKATGTITRTDHSHHRVQLTEKAYTEGEALGREVLDALRRRGWARVLRLPYAPSFDLGFPILLGPRGARHEVLGLGDEHIVSFSVTE